jgi:hypothetical protein
MRQVNAKDAARIAKPTIAEVLKRFLEDQRERLAAKTFANYKYVIELLQHSLDGYAYQSLDKADAQLFDRLYKAKGVEHREFCQVFGPEHILPNLGEFLGYFMVRKVIAGKETLRAAGTVTKKLAKWLNEKGYVEAEDAEDAAELGADAARDLPKAEEMSAIFHVFAEEQDLGHRDEEIEDHFALTRVEPGKIWVKGTLDGRDFGPIEVPEEVSRGCKVGWSISGVVGRIGKTWRLFEAWNVYPG